MVRIGLEYSVQVAVQELTPGSEFAPVESGACQELPLGVLLMQLIRWCSVVVKPSSEYVGSGASWYGLWSGQCHMLPVTSLGLPVRSYRVIHCW